MILTSHSEEVKQVPLKPAVEERQRSFSNLTTLNIPANKILFFNSDQKDVDLPCFFILPISAPTEENDDKNIEQ